MVDLWPLAKVGPSPAIGWVGRRRGFKAGTNGGDASRMRHAVAAIAGRRSLESCATCQGGRVRPLGRSLLALRNQASNQAPRDLSNGNEPTFAISFGVIALHAPEPRSMHVQEVGSGVQGRGI
jgi:hypothetical protein